MRFSDFLLVSDPGDLDFIVGYTEELNIRISVSDLFNGYITGSGTPGYIPVFTSTTGLGDSSIYQDGSNIVIGGEDSLDYTLAVSGSFYVSNGAVIDTTVSGDDGLRVIAEDGDIFIVPNDLGQSISSLRRIIHPPALITSESATLGQVNTAISNLEGDIDILLDLKVDKSSIGQPDGVASLDSGGKIPLSEIPDSIIGQVEYMGTWDAFTNTPTLNPLVPEEKGHYYVVSDAGVFGGVDYQVGDWIISNGVEWQKVDNTDAVTSVFGRIGAILALEADYQSFYPRLSQAYDNPTWINSLAFTKITDVPPFLLENQTITLSGDVTGSGKTSISSTISNNAVSNEKLRDSVGTSVIGRADNSVGDPDDIQATTDGHVLLRSAGNLLFGLISSDSISSIDWSKITGTPTTLSGYGITDAYTKTESDNKFVPYTGANANVNLGSNNITANSFIKVGGTSSQFLKADGSVDTSQYVPTTRSINAGTGLTGGGNLSSDVTIAFDTTWGDTRYAYRTRQLTINGTTYDLSADRSWTVGTVTSISTNSPITGGIITGSGTIGITQSSSSTDGYLSSTDWNIFNNKQPAGDYVTIATDQTITGIKTILRGGDVLNFKIGTDTLYGLKVAYNQNELVPSGEATWSFVNTFNNGSGIGIETTPISFFRGILVTGERLLSASINTNLLDYYAYNPSGRYPVYAYNTGVQQFSTGIIVGNTTGVVNAVTGSIADLPLGVVANFNGRVIGSNAVNSNEFVTLGQIPSLTGYVPYIGATQSVNLGEYGLESGFVTLDTTPTGTPVDQGTIYWDDSKSTAALIMNGTTQHIGQDTYFYVKNSSGSNIAKGVAVRFDGTDGASGHLLIAPFLADGTYPSAYFMGVTAEAIDNGSFGQVTNFGEIEGIDTSIYSAGDLLYASTTSAGAFQTTAPVAPNNIVLIAAAINSKNNGAIIVRPTYGSNINDDEGVKIVSPTTGDLLQLQAGGLWENKTKAQILGGTSSQFVKGDGSLDSTSYQPLLTNPVTGTGTTNYLPKFTGSTTIGNSVIADNTNEINIPKRIFLNSGTESIFFTPNLGGTSNRIEGSSGVPLEITTGGSSLKFAAGGTTPQITLASTGAVTLTGALNGTSAAFSDNITISKTNGASLQLNSNSTSSYSAFYHSENGTPKAYWEYINSNFAIASRRNYLEAYNLVGGFSVYTANAKALDISSTGAATFSSSVTTATFLRASSGAQSNPTGGASVAIDYQSTSDLQGRIRSRDWDGAAWKNLTIEANNIILSPSGNVGIGTSSPIGTLDVANLTPSLYIRNTKDGSWTSGETVGALNFYTNDVSVIGAHIVSSITSIHDGVSTTTPAGALVFSTAIQGATVTERLRITSGGNVLIGTTTDNGARLQVSGAATFSSSVTAVDTISINASTAGGTSSININGLGTNGTSSAGTRIDGIPEGSGAAASMAFVTRDNAGNRIEKMRITSAGNVGIGNTTPNSYTGTASTRVLAVGSTTGNNGVNVISGTTSTGSYMFSDSGGNDRGGLIYFHTADIMTLTTAGAERMRITSGGNLLVGTTSDNGARLQVSGGSGNITGVGVNYVNNTDDAFALVINNAGTSAQNDRGVFDARVSGNSVFRINNSGNVGIGTSSPLGKLSVEATGNHITLRAPGATAGKYWALDVTTANQFYLINNAGTQYLTITDGGNVGIGTASPSYPLQVRRAGGAGSLGISIDSVGTTDRVAQYFAIQDNASGAGTGHAFYYRVPSSTTDVLGLFLNESGNVGIGTSSPASRLQIEGTGTGAWLTIKRTDSGTNIVDFTQSGGRLGYVGYVVNDLYINNATASNTLFLTSATERMRLTSGGNLLLGTTTDSGYKLNVAGEISLDSYLRHNGDTDTFFGFSGNDEIKFRTAGSDRLLITSAGNVLIGTTTDNGARLQVSGTATFSSDVTTNATYNITYGLKLWGNHITTEWYNGNDTIFVNYRGYNSGTTQFRNFHIYNGKNSPIAQFDGSTGAATFSSSVTAAGTISSNITKSGVGVENVNFLQLRLFGTNAIGDSLDIRYLNNNGNNIANISAILGGDNVAYGSLAFSTRNYFTDSMVEVMRINNRGNVGIGTASPSTMLHVNYTSGTGLTLSNTVTNLYAEMRFQSANSSAYIFKASSGYTAYGGANALNIYNEGQTAFHSNSVSNILYLTTGGNVLIGTTTDVGARLYVDGAFRTGTLTAGTQTAAVDWRLGNARGGSATNNALIRVQINGVLVDLLGNYV